MMTVVVDREGLSFLDIDPKLYISSSSFDRLLTDTSLRMELLEKYDTDILFLGVAEEEQDYMVLPILETPKILDLIVPRKEYGFFASCGC